MTTAFVAFGSNIDAEENIRRAVQMLADRTRLVALSTFYRTAPAAGGRGPSFINGMAAIDTGLPAYDVKYQLLRRIEHERCRARSADKNAPRTIDLDLVHYDELVVATPELVLPDPELTHRAFLAAPLFELAPQLRPAALGIPIREVVQRLGTGGMEPLPSLTAELRRIIHE